MMFLKILLITIVLVALAIIGLAIRILLKPGGRFPETHVGHNKKMREMGIKCAKSNDIGCTPANRKTECGECGLRN